MKKQVASIDILAKVQANIDGALGQVDKLQKHLSTLKFPEGSTRNLDSSIEKIIEKIRDFEYAARQGVSSLEDAKKLEKSWKGVLDLLNKAGVRLEELGRVEGIFPQEVADNIDKATNAMKKYKAAREAVYNSQEYKDLKSKEDAAIANRKKAISSRESKKITATSSLANLQQEKENKQWKIRSKEHQELINLVKGYDDTIKAEKRYREELVKTNKFLTEKGEVRQKGVSQEERESQDYKDAIKAAEEYSESLKRVDETARAREELTGGQYYQSLVEDAKAIEKLEEKYAKANSEMAEAEAYFEATDKAVQNNTKAVNEFVKAQTDSSWSKLTDSLKELGASSVDIDRVKENLGEINTIIQSYQTEHIADVKTSFELAEQALDDFNTEAKEVQEQNHKTAESFEAMNRQAEEMEGLKNSILQFFSITNAIQLFKSAVNGALNTVKELDATMTEAAVVTEFDVSDMWEKLPEYSKQAQQLGVSINGMYQATTLYYQQGLKTNEAMALGVETMKMAKIAGMESAEATKAMTAALRGFNMELNETSATRVNDVYSELAAVTAADTEQIATAMSKTASIAAAANMEFETTAALLAQIIETTQEAPETAGTAMKTIIARFSEVKSLRDQGLASGQDSEGEDIDVNKIQTALKTVGISMDGFFAGTEGLDSILLKLADKWNTLDTETQRYIATMAAGSRQQSRFIAMMSDYGRTTELVAAANESAGASQKQFEKTLDSMETKLQKLENAWNEFLMGLANNEILKGAVDTLTFIIEGVNKLTEAISGGNGLAKSIVSLTTVIAALKAGGSLFNNFGIQEIQQEDGSIVKQFVRISKNESQKAGAEAGQGFMSGFKRMLKSGKQGGFKAGAKGFFGKDKEKFVGADKASLLKQIQTDLNNAEPDSKLNKELTQLRENLEQGKISADEAAVKFKALGTSAEISGQSVKTFTVDMQNVGIAIAGVGGALGLLASLFEELGWDGLAESVSTVATVFMGLGTTISVLTTLFPALGTAVTIEGGKMILVGIGVQLAWWQVALIIGAVVAVIAGLVIAFKKIKESSDEFKLEKLNEQLQELGQAADEAKERLEAMGQARMELEKMQDTFSNLVYGSQEWKKALVENNLQVLELLDTYPELAKYMTHGESGELTFTDEGWNELLEKQQREVIITTNAGMATQQTVDEKEYSIQRERALEELREKTFDQEIPSGVKPGDYDNMVEQLFKEGYVLDETGRARAKELYSAAGYSDNAKFDEIWAQMSELSSIFEDVAASALEVELAEQARVETITKANVLMSQQVSESEYEDAVVSAAAQAYGDYNEMVYNEQVMNYGYDTNKQKEELIREYEASTGKSSEEIKEALENNQLSYEQMSRYLATEAVDKRMIKTMEFMVTRFDKVDEKDRKQVAGLLTNRGLGLTQSQLTNSKGTGLLQQDMAIYLKNTLGIDTDEKAQAAGWTNLDTMVEGMKQNVKNAELAFSQAYSRAASFGVDEIIKSSLSRMGDMELTAQQTQSLANSLADVAANGGDVQNLMNKFPQLLKNLSGDELDFAIDTIATTDWTRQESIDTTIAALEKLGMVIDEDFTREIYSAANAVMSLNLDKIENELSNLQDLLDMVESKGLDDSKVYTKEEKEKLITAGFAEHDFIRTGFDEYIFTGETDALLGQINDKVGQILGEMQGELDYAIERGMVYSNIMAGDRTYIDVFGQMFSASKILEQIGRDKLDSTVPLSVLQDLASELKIKGWESMDSTALVEAIKMGYENYYLKLEENLKKSILTNSEQITIKYAQEAGSNEYMHTLATANKKAERIKWLVASDQEALAKNARGEVISEDLARNLAGQLGLEGAEGKSIEEIRLWLADFYNEGLRAEQVMGALIGATAGLDTAQEYFTSKLAETNKELSENENLIKNAVIGNNKANEAIDGLNAALGDQLEAFKIGDKSSAIYRASLERITAAAKKVFGDNITEEFVHNNRELFEQLTLGGDIAQNAFQELGIRMAQSMTTEANRDAIRKVLQSWFNAEEVGTAFDAQDLVNQIGEAAGLNPKDKEQLDQIIAIAQAGGITIRVDDNNDAIGVIQSVEGTGLNDFSSTGWENPYDKFYNTLERINTQLRIREKLEKAYQRILDSEDTSAQDLLENSKEQLKSLGAQAQLQQYLLEGKRAEAAEYQRQNSGLNKYAKLNTETGELWIDWAAIQGLEGTESGEVVEEYVSNLEELRDQFQEAEDALWEIDDQTREIMNQGKNEYLELENMIKDAIVAARQEEIDKLSAINDTISETNTKLIESMQQTLDRQRQARDNEKTEQEIAEKQQRLAYLQQDTSGANATEILKLQEEIDQAQEDYTDTLIDQKISELQRQNDEAAEQRAQQIAIMEEQLANYQESGAIWAEVQELWKQGIGEDGLIAGSKMQAMLMASADWNSMSTEQKKVWAEDLGDKAAAASAWDQLRIELLGSDNNFTSILEGLSDKSYIPIVDGAVKATGEVVIKDEDGDKGEKKPDGGIEITIETKGGYAYDQNPSDRPPSRDIYRVTLTQFKQGGLADFTGPAWLDGTKSNPEYILNAGQTKAFFQLVDVLDSLKTNGAPITQNGGDSTFDIDINVESLSSDYDVEQIALKVKDFIVNSSRYRNNNTL